MFSAARAVGSPAVPAAGAPRPDVADDEYFSFNLYKSNSI